MAQADRTNALSGWKAAGIGVAIAMPTVIASVFFLSRIGLGDPERDLTAIAISALAFAAVPAAATAAGLAKVVARGTSWAAPGTLGVLRGAAVGSPAGVGLVILTALPLGHLPRDAGSSWWWVIAAGVLVGLALGAVLGALAEPDPDESQSISASDSHAASASDPVPASASDPVPASASHPAPDSDSEPAPDSGPSPAPAEDAESASPGRRQPASGDL